MDAEAFIPRVEDVLALYRHTMELPPEAVSDAQRACAEGATHQAAQAALYRDDIDDLTGVDPLTVAAYLLTYLLKDHCFPDGNKRLAWKACLNYLMETCDATIDASDDDAVAFVEHIAARPHDVDPVFQWLSTHLVELRP